MPRVTSRGRPGFASAFWHQEVEEAIQVANQLRHAVTVLRATIIDWRYPSGMPEPAELSLDPAAT